MARSLQFPFLLSYTSQRTARPDSKRSREIRLEIAIRAIPRSGILVQTDRQPKKNRS